MAVKRRSCAKARRGKKSKAEGVGASVDAQALLADDVIRWEKNVSDASMDANYIPRQVTRNVKILIITPKQNWALSQEHTQSLVPHFETIQLVATQTATSSQRILHQSINAWKITLLRH